jgi:hypothetical protein
MALGISAMIAAPCYAQRGRSNWAQSRPADRPPKPPKPPARQQQEGHRAQAQKQQNGNANRPPQGNPNRPDTNARLNNNPNRPPSAYTPPPPKRFDSLNQQEKHRVLENNRRFQNLPPAQRQQMREAADNWGKLTPEQRSHIKNDVLPKWRQLPPERQRAIQQRLGVLQNMPESARNQHLNDPNFTRGMSEEDKATLRDLSHLHVGAPDPPSE